MKPPQLQSVDKAKVTGVSLDKKIAVQNIDILTRTTSGVQGQNNSLGNQKTLVILTNFQNDTAQPFSQETIRDIIVSDSGIVNRYYKENSFNQTYFSGDVVGWYTIPIDNSPCKWQWPDSPWRWAELADQEASSQGINVDSYQRMVG